MTRGHKSICVYVLVEAELKVPVPTFRGLYGRTCL